MFLCYGSVRPYKNIETLIRAFQSLDDTDVLLLIVGRPRSDAYARQLVRLIGADSRIRYDFRHVSAPDTELYSRVQTGGMPYREVFTSGAAMLALTFGRPVLIKRTGFSSDTFPPRIPSFSRNATRRICERRCHPLAATNTGFASRTRFSTDIGGVPWWMTSSPRLPLKKCCEALVLMHFWSRVVESTALRLPLNIAPIKPILLIGFGKSGKSLLASGLQTSGVLSRYPTEGNLRLFMPGLYPWHAVQPNSLPFGSIQGPRAIICIRSTEIDEERFEA